MKKLFAVIGDPIEHSMSPQMHNDLFQYYSIDAHYQPFLVKGDKLKDAMNGFRAIGISGFNVTIPHKTDIIPFLDEVDPLAEQIGAVNTVINQDGRFIGYNTDALGYLTGLKAITKNLNSENILIVGAGGAARAIFYALASEGVQSLDICNRTLENARKLIEACPYKTSSNALSIVEAEENLQHYGVIIQTTSIGMSPHVQYSPLSTKNLKQGCIVSDIIYNPLETLFLKEAKEKQAFIQNGVDMFVLQGALAFEYWTGISPDINRMKRNVVKQLGGSIC
jgi:shikimate dehydrogenase